MTDSEIRAGSCFFLWFLPKWKMKSDRKFKINVTFLLTRVTTSDIIIMQVVTMEETGGKAAMAIIKQYHKDTDTTYV